jgi:hypothetical protein
MKSERGDRMRSAPMAMHFVLHSSFFTLTFLPLLIVHPPLPPESPPAKPANSAAADKIAGETDETISPRHEGAEDYSK